MMGSSVQRAQAQIAISAPSGKPRRRRQEGMSYLLMRLEGAKTAFRSLVSSLGEESWGQKARNEVKYSLGT